MSDAEPWTVLRLITWTTDYLKKAGVDEPRLAAEVLLAHILGCQRIALYTRFDQAVEAEPRGAYRDLVKRAGAHEPIAYLVGQREFYSLPIKVTPAVLIPRPETELLVDVVLECVKKEAAGRLWDACTGSGCVAVAAAHYATGLRVLATDISPEALAVALENVAQHSLAERVRVEQADLLNLPAEAAELSPFDVITANPPYVSAAQEADLPAVVRQEPRTALVAGESGYELIERVIREAPPRLRPGGTLAIEMGMGQAQRVYDLLRQGGYEEIRILKDVAGIERTTVARRPG